MVLNNNLIISCLLLFTASVACQPAFTVPRSGSDSDESEVEDSEEDREDLFNEAEEAKTQTAPEGGFTPTGELITDALQFHIVCESKQTNQQRYSEGAWAGPRQEGLIGAKRGSGNPFFRSTSAQEVVFRRIPLNSGNECFLHWLKAVPGMEITQSSFRQSVLLPSNEKREILGPHSAELDSTRNHWYIPLSQAILRAGTKDARNVTHRLDLRLTSTDHRQFNIRVNFSVEKT